MKNGTFCLLLIGFLSVNTFTQPMAKPSAKGVPIFSRIDTSLITYRESSARINDLVHTKLEVRFDYAKHFLMGKEWITLKPHFYPTDSLILDAKGMEIHFLGLQEGSSRRKLNYTYNNESLKINLGKTYTSHQNYILYIDYTAKPDEIKQKGSAAITSAKGLYFINADGKELGKPIQIWTQGETESSSCWFPTIDKPNQKTTEEISMTVPSKYVSLSNGKLIMQKKNSDGTRTDTWKMDLPHAPYLFMMAVGDFKIFHDHWKNKEVNYYLEPKYAPFAKQIFGSTPEMMSFYAKITGIDFPWNKYSQIVVRDYVSGAMENTTATLHGESVQKTARELLDENSEGVICHELFHQWFGDYVTCESWSNITLNESFATLSEILWAGYKRGKDAEDAERFDKLNTYLNSTQNGKSPSLVRFHYADKEDVFDNISYPKGSVILYSLKNLIGDDAFFAGLNLYLKTNAFKTAEAPQLRLAFEQVTGMDLNWFFNQWYFGQGHPILDIQNTYSEGIVTLKINQVQDISLPSFEIPLKMGVYHDGKMEIKKILVNGRSQIIHFPSPGRPNLLDWDIDKILVGEIRDHKTPEEWAFAYTHAPSFANRLVAVQNALKEPNTPFFLPLITKALHDPSYLIRQEIVQGLDLSKPEILTAVESQLYKIAESDPNPLVRGNCIEKLSETQNPKYIPLCDAGLQNLSYSVIGASMSGLLSIDSRLAEKKLKTMDRETLDHLQAALAKYYASLGEDGKAGYFDGIFKSSNPSPSLQIYRYYLSYLKKNNNPIITQKGVENIVHWMKSLHQKDGNEIAAANFRGIAGAKSEEASTTLDAKLKEVLNIQSQIFLKGASDLLKNE